MIYENRIPFDRPWIRGMNSVWVSKHTSYFFIYILGRIADENGIIETFTHAAGVNVETRDISLSGRIIANFPEFLNEEQRISDALAELGEMAKTPEANIIKFSEEHGFLDLKDCKKKPVVGDIVTVIPNHVCVAVNMVDELVLVQNNTVLKTVQVTARGMLV